MANLADKLLDEAQEKGAFFLPEEAYNELKLVMANYATAALMDSKVRKETESILNEFNDSRTRSPA